MISSKINLNDNILLKYFLIFIPFNYALTLRIGFPLKVSEVVLFLILSLYYYFQKPVLAKGKIYEVLIIFCLFASFSTVINLFWHYNYQLNSYVTRIDYRFDSILKLIYLYLAFLALLISDKAFSTDKKAYLKWFLVGATICAYYSWYLFIFSLFKLPVFLLPGMDEAPQMANLSFGDVIRCGTFKEGNFLGLFMLISSVIALYSGKFKKYVFFLVTTIISFSSIAVLCSFIFILMFYFSKYFTRKNLIKLLVFFSGLAIILLLLYNNKDFKFLITSKFFGNTKVINNNAEYSKADRLNSLNNAISIGNQNPLLGVGLSNYALHISHVNQNKLFFRPNFKDIPNNVYAEIFSELGYIGLLLFCFLLWYLYTITKLDESKILRKGFITTLIYFIAFPTFTILFVWVFWGLIVSLLNDRHLNVSSN